MADPDNPDPLTKITGYVEFKKWKISFKNVTKWGWILFFGVFIGWIILRQTILVF